MPPKPGEKDFNNWYNGFISDLKTELGINVYNANDMKRLRVPTEDGLGTKPLFEDALKNTEAEKYMLYEKAKEGKLFAFQKETNKPYQLTEDGKMHSCDKADEKAGVSFAQIAGYKAVGAAWAVPRFGIGLAGRLFNLATLGIFKNQVKALGKGLDMMTSAWSERLFSVGEQEKGLSLKDRIGNFPMRFFCIQYKPPLSGRL